MNTRQTIAIASLATAAVIGGAVLLAPPADAHTPNITASCAGVRIQASSYQANQTNRWSVTIAGVTQSGTFATGMDQTFPVPQGGASTAWSASIDVVQSNTYDQFRSGTVGPCGTATPTPTPTPTPSSTPTPTPTPSEPPTTPPTSTPPVVPPIPPAVAVYKPRHAIYGNCSLITAWLLNEASTVRARSKVTIVGHSGVKTRTFILKAAAGQNRKHLFNSVPGQWFSIVTRGLRPKFGHAPFDCTGGPGGS